MSPGVLRDVSSDSLFRPHRSGPAKALTVEPESTAACGCRVSFLSGAAGRLDRVPKGPAGHSQLIHHVWKEFGGRLIGRRQLTNVQHQRARVRREIVDRRRLGRVRGRLAEPVLPEEERDRGQTWAGETDALPETCPTC